MPRISLKTLLILVAFVAVLMVPLSFVAHHFATWPAAEQTENMLAELYLDACSSGSENVTIADINNLLERPKYVFLKRHRVHNTKLKDDELAWFSPNNKYSIGLTRDGSKLWIVNGTRTY